MKEIIRKLSSRKLWLAIAGVVVGIAISLGADTSDIGEVAGAVTTIVSVVVYIVTEGKIDADSVKQTIIEVQEAVDILDGEGE